MTPEEKLEFCEQWYAVRWERLHAYAKGLGEPYFSDICSIMGNGTLTGALQKRGEAPGYEPPSYARILNGAIHDRDKERNRCITKTVETLIAWKVHTLGIPIETIREGIREALDPKN